MEKQLEDENPCFGKFPCMISAVKDFFEQGLHREVIFNSLLEEDLRYIEEAANKGDVQIMEISLIRLKKLAQKEGKNLSLYSGLIERILETGYSNGINKKLKDAEELAIKGDETRTIIALHLAEKYSLETGRDAPQDINRILDILINKKD